MHFVVIPSRANAPSAADTCFLEVDSWDDFGFKTLFKLYYRDSSAIIHHIGEVKIGQAGLTEADSRPGFPEEFNQLTDDFFSLGQDRSYYEELNKLGYAKTEEILQSLNDVALDLDLFDRVLRHRVTGVSLMRNVSWTTVRNQFHRITLGGLRLSRFEFGYTYPIVRGGVALRPSLLFSVVPDAYPPRNVHVIIGRNGVGKSRLLNNMTAAILSSSADVNVNGRIEFKADTSGAATSTVDSLGGVPQFAGIVSVAFSAFDEFEPYSTPRDKPQEMQYTYIGLKKIAQPGAADQSSRLKDSQDLAKEFGESVKICLQRSRVGRWKRALELLGSDPIFADAQVTGLTAEINDDGTLRTDDETLRTQARTVFRGLSSGHKIVLLTMTRLVESVEERTLVLIDEPEAHLHPPLLSAFIRALSGLLVNRNGVAIIATHSPVVLQEIPRECVWQLRRSGEAVTAERPQIETFGENVGTLTYEVFGLEVTESGFHRMIADAVSVHDSYDEVLAAFGGSIGSEGRALVQALLAAKDAGDEDGRS